MTKKNKICSQSS